jgi:hypothetical protein
VTIVTAYYEAVNGGMVDKNVNLCLNVLIIPVFQYSIIPVWS